MSTNKTTAASGQLDKTNQTRLEELKIEAKKIEKAKKVNIY